MSVEVAVVAGLSAISGLLGHFAFKLSESPEPFNQRISLFVFFISLVFLNLVMYSVHKIASESAPYLLSGIMQTGLLVMMWTTLIFVFILLLATVYLSIKSIYVLYKNHSRSGGRDE